MMLGAGNKVMVGILLEKMSVITLSEGVSP